MKPEARDYLAKARDDLDDAEKIARIGLAKVAARSAYYAAFHAAEAFIINRTGKIVKTHSGVRAELARLLQTSPADKPLAAFLAQAYKFKEIGDYGIGLGATVSGNDAAAAIREAGHFVDRITALLALDSGNTAP
jgi:uncharacterized protein (UPF0332 family)